jgi:hypothetical protein
MSSNRARLRTKNVFVDTSIHVAAKFTYGSGRFARLTQLATDDLANVVDTMIDVGEIRSNIEEQAELAADALRKFQREAQVLSTATDSSITALLRPTDKATIAAQFTAAYTDYRNKTRVRSTPLNGLDIESVFADYFARRSPFGAEKKRSEFPDAFIISALEEWCRQNDQLIYVVTHDHGMREAAAASAVLLPLASLDEFLDLVVSEEHRAAAAILQRWLVNHREAVAEGITAAFENTGFMLEEYDGDVDNVKVEMLKAAEPLLVEIGDDEAVAEVPCEITFSADISYGDPDTAVYDSEDHALFYIHYRRARVQATHEINAELRLSFEPGGEEAAVDNDTVELNDILVNGGDDIRVSPYDELVAEYPDHEDSDSEEYYHWHSSD